MSDLKTFQELIGYTFQKEQLLKQALTHSSYANEKHLKKLSDNERLEFLGDAVLEVVSSEFLYQNYPNLTEGQLTKLRASIVCEPTLATCTESIHLGDYLFLGKGEDHTGGRTRKSVLSDAMEAVIGSIYLDGGIECARDFINKFILNDIDSKSLFVDSKTILQERIQTVYKDGPEYVLIGESGPDHNKTFEAEVRIEGKIIGKGIGRTKKAAEQQAAYNAILRMEKK